ncbi:hypothetical protein BN1048_00599 [Jeotgalicoccus saudimassiliensis]|uniref:Uncharacterized protein n=1 Tax=Jeotgalicoccus saudimassiliensis TaxID=1461582 RepID=A0A078M0I0_9STAP|nr:hypothetical protein BN1048_00599 [Jeotgalicoccus saudimassiliensis]
MYRKLFIIGLSLILIIILSVLIIFDESTSNNLVNKINTVEDRWVNYKGTSENNKAMMQSQFILYNPEKDYEISRDTYVSYFNGEDFIKTELYEDTPEMLNTVEEADGIILSFNKNNKNGMQLVEID